MHVVIKFIAVKFWVLMLGLALLGYDLHAQEWNLGFENWNDTIVTPSIFDTVVDNRVGIFPSNWFSNPEYIPEGRGIGQTTDSYDGGYAVVLSGYYQYETMRITSGTSPEQSGWPIDYRPTELRGNYKALLLCSTCDSLRAYVNVYATRYQVDKNKRDTIGKGQLILPQTTSEYVDFSLPISYADNQEEEPDSITIVIAKTRFGFGNQFECWECSHVFFDNFSLPVLPVAINKTKNVDTEFLCYPNPAKNQLTISNLISSSKRIHVVDLTGKVHFDGTMESNSEFTISTQCIQGGLLLISDGTSTKKIIVTN